MKFMKKIGILLVALVLSVCFLLTGCTPTLTMPTGEIKSNGGNVVVIGDYIYYANTFVDYSTLQGDDNNTSTVTHDGMFRIKTENGKIVRDDNGSLQNVENVYSKIAGYSTSNMFVVGNYLYFTSPNTHKAQETAVDKFDLSTLFRIKLDGTDFKEILTTVTTSGVFYLDYDNRLFIYDNNEIKVIELKDNIGKTTTLVNDVTATVFPKNFGERIISIYYTKALTEDEGVNAGITGNKLYKINTVTKESTLVSMVSGKTITPIAFEDGRLYYKRTDNNGEDVIYSNSFTGGFESAQVQHTFVADDTISSNFFVVGNDDNGDALPVFYKYNSKIYLDYEVVVNEDASLKFIAGDYLYYTTTSGLFRISYKDKEIQTISNQTNLKDAKLDFDGRYVYFYAFAENNVTDTYYLYRADTKTAELGRINTEIISKVLSEDIIGPVEE